MIYAMKARSFHPSEVVEAGTWFDIPEEDEAAYDAPYPSRTYMAGIRVFPSLVNDLPGATAEARLGLEAFERPFLTIWAGNDGGGLGGCEIQDELICGIPGAQGQPHVRLPEASHFLQDDQGPAIASRIVSLIQNDGSMTGNHQAQCD
jgi:haloalkane dehalogenase